MIQKVQFTLTGANEKPVIGDYTYDDKKTNSGTIIFVHGFKGFKDWGAHNQIAAWFAMHGYRYLKFNMSHCGVTDQNLSEVTDLELFAANTISKELYDLGLVIDEVSAKFGDAPIVLVGHSRGGGISIVKAADDPRITKLITWSAIADFSSLWKKEQEKEWMETGKIFVENARTKEKMPLHSALLIDYNANKKEFDILSAAERISIPWLILHGDDDVNVDFSVAQLLASRQLKAKINKIEGANHVYGASHPYTAGVLPGCLQQVVEKTMDFIDPE